MRSISQEIRNVVVFFLAAVLTFNLESNRLSLRAGERVKCLFLNLFVCFCCCGRGSSMFNSTLSAGVPDGVWALGAGLMPRAGLMSL